MTQRERVLRALDRVGSHGITSVDFQLPDVIDGGPPILRMPARIDELRQAGHHIQTRGWRQKCALYVLARSPEEERPAQAPRGPQDEPTAALLASDEGRPSTSPYYVFGEWA